MVKGEYGIPVNMAGRRTVADGNENYRPMVVYHGMGSLIMIGTNARVPGWGPARCTHWRVIGNVTWWRMESRDRTEPMKPMCVWRNHTHLDTLPQQPPAMYDTSVGPELPPLVDQPQPNPVLAILRRHQSYAPGKYRFLTGDDRRYAQMLVDAGQAERWGNLHAYRMAHHECVRHRPTRLQYGKAAYIHIVAYHKGYTPLCSLGDAVVGRYWSLYEKLGQTVPTCPACLREHQRLGAEIVEREDAK